jgi:hypothetical protein
MRFLIAVLLSCVPLIAVGLGFGLLHVSSAAKSVGPMVMIITVGLGLFVESLLSRALLRGETGLKAAMWAASALYLLVAFIIVLIKS